ncbi:MAG: VCBS repeat-containing protein, partial [Candidatus Hydrogenedentes bacterium]|nr:VCBS repeat-containing protein [Candidatus Hydrogenedentota bacterium]
GDPAVLPCLLPLAETAEELTLRVLAVRGIARLACAPEVEETAREDALRRALGASERSEEKKLLLGALSGCHTAGALKCVEGCVFQDDVAAEAVMAWTQVADALLTMDVDVERAGAQNVLESARQAGVPQHVQQAAMKIVGRIAATPVPGDQVRFEHVVVDGQFRSEGVAVADVDRDGRSDILAGDLWYAAPDWQARELRPLQSYDAQQGYSQCFANFASDVDQDGWIDSIIIGFPAAPALWYRNPGEANGHWESRPLAPSACGETPLFGDLLGDGQALPVFAMNSRITWFKPRDDKNAEWQAFPVTQELPEFAKFGHGLGMGDVNGDGRADLIGTGGWWEAPEDRSRSDWPFHRASLGPACANMLVYDVDGDGDSDIVTSSAHQYGIWWFEQRPKNGAASFERHEIDKGLSQTHALILADMNSDGLMDLVTGKRYRAHNGHDPGSDEPAVLCWLELQRPNPGEVKFVMHEIHNDSGVGTQFEVCDLDGDGLLDVVTSNKKGVHAFVQKRSN